MSTKSIWSLNSKITIPNKNYDYIIVGASISGSLLAYHITLIDKNARILMISKDTIEDMNYSLNAGFITMGSIKFLAKLGEEYITDIEENIIQLKNIIKKLKINIIKKGSTSKVKNISEFSSLIQNKKYLTIKSKGFVHNSMDISINPYELISKLHKYLIKKNIKIKYSTEAFNLKNNQTLETSIGKIQAKKIFFCTNLIPKFLKLKDLTSPTRAQILSVPLIGKEKNSGNIYDCTNRIYYRFFNNKVIIGGLRSIDLKNENTILKESNPKIINALIKYLNRNQIKHNINKLKCWSGIMSFTKEELPIIKKYNSNIYFIGGYSGHGNSFSYFLTKELAKFSISGKTSQRIKKYLV